MQPMNSVSDLAQNMPQVGLDYIMNAALFGNTGWQLQPSMSGEVSNTFGTFPYTSEASLIYIQQMQAAASATNQQSGSVSGQQNVTGALTVSDGNGNIVAQISAGSLPSSGAASTSQPTS